jgi:hypothetical protein
VVQRVEKRLGAVGRRPFSQRVEKSPCAAPCCTPKDSAQLQWSPSQSAILAASAICFRFGYRKVPKMRQVGFVRLFTDECGESHFAEVELDLEPSEFAPPSPPLQVAALFPATRCAFLCAPLEWDGSTPHPTPRRQLMCNLRGAYEVTASDGTVRRFPAGSVLLLEDTVGKGHTSRIVSDEDVLFVAITLAD